MALDTPPPARPAAVLLDMDGTLIDSEPAWSRAARQTAISAGCRWDEEDDRRIVGWSLPSVVAYLHARGVRTSGDVLVIRLHDLVRADLGADLPWRPGARELLVALRDHGVPCAMVTMTHTRLAAVVADAAPRGTLRTVVTGDQVSRPKPDPEAYLQAADALGVDPAACVALEDSPTGVRAALAAGALTYAVDPGQAIPAGLAGHPRLRHAPDPATVLTELAPGLTAAG